MNMSGHMSVNSFLICINYDIFKIAGSKNVSVIAIT